MAPSNTQGIMKMSYPHRRLLVRVALLFALAAVSLISVATFTNEWIYTAEVLKFWTSNETANNVDMFDYERPVVHKNATFGPWLVCWLDLAFAVMGAVLSFICTVQEGRRNSLTLTVGVCHIFAGMQNLLALVVFLSAVLGEVGHKLTAESPIDDPAFLYACGYSFYCAVVAFMCTEVTAALSLCVYMAAHDERMFNRYQIRTIMRTGSSHSMSESLGQKRKIGGPQGRRFRRSSSGGFRVRSLSSTDIQSPKVSVSDANLGPFSRDMTNCSFITDSGVFTDISTNV